MIKNRETKYAGFISIAIGLLLYFVIIPQQIKVKPSETISGAFFVKLCAFFFMLLGLGFLLEGFCINKSKNNQKALNNVKTKKENDNLNLQKNIFFIVMLMLAVYVFLFDVLGYIISTFIFLGFFFWFLKAVNVKGLVVITISVTLLIYCIFEVLLKVPLPRGIF